MVLPRLLTILISPHFIDVVCSLQPKYIQNILKAAELRKKEQEKRMEKKIQKEREMEGDAFDDKEAFVTSAYKKKLQERAEEAEREKREAALEGERMGTQGVWLLFAVSGLLGEVCGHLTYMSQEQLLVIQSFALCILR